MTGVNASTNVNVDASKEIGEKILTSMRGKIVEEYSFKQSEQAVTLGSKSKVRIGNDMVQIDPQLLFQRLILACSNFNDIEEVFKYELCIYPTALFDSPQMLRQPQKPVLADALWDKLSIEATSGPAGENVRYVLDGGALLHRMPWPRGSPTNEEVCTLYCHYVTKKYGSPIIVFDGYEKLSTKSMTQHRRTSGKVGATVTGLRKDMRITMKKDHFLSNAENKQQFIFILSDFLERAGCKTHHAKGDANVLIVKTALESARTRSTVLIGDDTDLLVLLCYLTNPDVDFDIYFKPEPKAKSNKRRVWNIKKVQEQWGLDVCHNILFIHAIL